MPGHKTKTPQSLARLLALFPHAPNVKMPRPTEKKDRTNVPRLLDFGPGLAALALSALGRCRGCCRQGRRRLGRREGFTHHPGPALALGRRRHRRFCI